MLLLVAAVSAGIIASVGDDRAVVSAPAGTVAGTTDGVIQSYKGIPYAVPPVGARRWQAPQRATRWPGVRRAIHFAPACPQLGVSMPGEVPPAANEDCLYLNIWTPLHSSRAPVIVWLHGGGFTNGSAAMPLYWGDQLARRGVIVVTVGYRLGPLGYLAHPALTAESSRHTSGNYGLLDQIAALRWVRSNITAFGGDPSRVTIAGQSAGATSVSLLMASPLAKGLFAGAIAQSGGLFEPIEIAPGYRLVRAEQAGIAYARSLGATSLAALRRIPVGELLGGVAASVSHPVIDQVVLPRTPYDAYAAGVQNDVPILIGSTADEARSLIPNPSSIRAATFEQQIAETWGALPPTLLAAYPHLTDAEASTARLGLERDLRFGWDMWAWARLQAAKSKRPAFYYHFDADPPFPKGSVYEGWHASHFSDLWYMFDHLGQEAWQWTAADRRLSDVMASYWVNFARSGDPNGGGLPPWPAFTPADPATQHLGTSIRTGKPANLPTLSVFDATYSTLRGTPFGVPSK